MKYISFILLIQLCILVTATAQNLLFKSGFEPVVAIDVPLANSGKWFQTITGTDMTTGYEWPNDFPTQDSLGAYWTYKVPDTENLSDYVEVDIERVVGHDGDSTNALFMGIKDYEGDNFDGTMQGHVRAEYRLNLDTTMTQAYASYWLKVQPNLYEVMRYDKGGWRMIMEWFESGTDHADYRWNLTMRTNKPDADTSFSFWRLSNEFVNGPGNPGDFETDTVVHHAGLVPEDWFKVEVFWRQRPDSSGRIWVAIDGETIFDKWGSNMKDSHIQNWQIFKLYTDTLSMTVGKVYQWIDDVEIWDDFPSGSVPREENPEIPDSYRLHQNYPNPFNPSTVVSYQLAENSMVQLEVFDLLGRKIQTLVNERKNAGMHSIQFRTFGLPSGIYIYRLKAPGFTQVRKMMLLK